jgi:simple sugar transport system permease protein
MISVDSLIQSIIASTMPILLAMLGETFSERSGVVNLGMDGIMLMAASTGFIATLYLNNIMAGVAFGVLMGMLLALVVAFLSIDLRLNQTIVGVAIWIFGLGASSLLWIQLVFNKFGVVYINTITPKPIPLISDIPIVGGFARQTELVYLAYVLIILTYFILEKTTLGLKISAAGDNAMGADIIGINVRRLRYTCVVVSGMFGGLAGALITLNLSGSWANNITAGSGWIAVALVRAGQWNPLLATIGTFVFGAVTNLQFTLQVTNIPIPYEFFLALPYVVGIISLAVFRASRAQPKDLGKPYKRE